ncbi:protein FAM32A [Pogona vitticeps]
MAEEAPPSAAHRPRPPAFLPACLLACLPAFARRRSVISADREGVGVDRGSPGMSSEYQAVQRGPLRLKGGVEVGSAAKRKKKKGKEKNKIVDQIVSSKKQEEEDEEKTRALDKRTPAQLAYEKMQEKRQIERILKKASKTHKQRVEDFNRHLDTLTEHYDIPKVSWTK